MDNIDTATPNTFSELSHINALLEQDDLCPQKREVVLQLSQDFCEAVSQVVNQEMVSLSRTRENKTIRQALGILKKRLKHEDFIITSPGDAKDYMVLKLAHREREVFAVMFLNNKHQLIKYEEMFYGTIDGTSVHPREVVKAALKHNAAAIVVAHNHPSGVVDPSPGDKAITFRLNEALALVEVRLLDHIIAGANGTYSMAEHGVF